MQSLTCVSYTVCSICRRIESTLVSTECSSEPWKQGKNQQIAAYDNVISNVFQTRVAQTRTQILLYATTSALSGFSG
jgi:hypothetical protein